MSPGVTHGIVIDWTNEEEECACGYRPKEGSEEEYWSSIPDLERHLKAAWLAEALAPTQTRAASGRIWVSHAQLAEGSEWNAVPHWHDEACAVCVRLGVEFEPGPTWQLMVSRS